MKTLFWAAACIAMTTAFPAAAEVPTFLGTIVGSPYRASGITDITNTGTVLGWTTDAYGHSRSAILVDGMMTEIQPGSPYSGYTAVNGRGDYVTSTGVCAADGSKLRSLTGFDNVSAINDRGQVGGIASIDSNPVVSTSGQGAVAVEPVDLQYAPRHGFLNDLSNTGYVAGTFWGRADEPWQWAYRAIGQDVMRLEDLGGNSHANAVNDSGIAVGSAAPQDSYRDQAVMWDLSGRLTNLHALLPGATYSAAYDINNAGDVVGAYTSYEGNGFYHGFLYHDGAMYNLDTLLSPDGADFVTGAYVINDLGQIGARSGGKGMYAVLLDPVSPVPEPSSATMLLCGFLVVVTMGRANRISRLVRVPT